VLRLKISCQRMELRHDLLLVWLSSSLVSSLSSSNSSRVRELCCVLPTAPRPPKSDCLLQQLLHELHGSRATQSFWRLCKLLLLLLGSLGRLSRALRVLLPP
jgi:hypothetical protein